MGIQSPDSQRERGIHFEVVMKTLLSIVLGLGLLGCGKPAPTVAEEEPVAPSPASVPTEPTALTGGELYDVVAFQEWAGSKYLVVDVRKTDSIGKHLVPGAIPVYLEKLGPLYPGLADHDKSIPVLVIADEDPEALRAAQMLTIAGYRAGGLKGGIYSWITAGFPTKIKLEQ